MSDDPEDESQFGKFEHERPFVDFLGEATKLVIRLADIGVDVSSPAAQIIAEIMHHLETTPDISADELSSLDEAMLSMKRFTLG